MKWHKQWASLLSDLPPQLQITSINYKLWKKTIKQKHIDKDMLFLKLKGDIAIVDREFRKAIAKSKKHDKRHIIQMYAKINKTTLYKIIKRCDKIRGIDLKNWHNKQVNYISFCNGLALKRFEIEVGSHPRCPICRFSTPIRTLRQNQVYTLKKSIV